MISIIQNDKRCYICAKEVGLELHHCFFGANRKVSEKWGLKVWLCKEHHTGDYSPHHNEKFDKSLKVLAQQKWMDNGGTIEEWMDIKVGIGKNYL